MRIRFAGPSPPLASGYLAAESVYIAGPSQASFIVGLRIGDVPARYLSVISRMVLPGCREC